MDFRVRPVRAARCDHEARTRTAPATRRPCVRPLAREPRLPAESTRAHERREHAATRWARTRGARTKMPSPIRLAAHRRQRRASLRDAPPLKPMRSEASLVFRGPRGRRRGAQDFGAGAKRPRDLTSRSCPSAAAAGRVASSARAPKSEHRRAVRAADRLRRGRLFLVPSFGETKEGTRPPGRDPAWCHTVRHTDQARPYCAKRFDTSARTGWVARALRQGEALPLVLSLSKAQCERFGVANAVVRNGRFDKAKPRLQF